MIWQIIPMRVGISILALVSLVLLAASACSDSQETRQAGPTTTLVITQAVPLTHPVVGREDCRSCHLKGVNRAKKMPDSHATYVNDTCLLCHGLPGVKPPP